MRLTGKRAIDYAESQGLSLSVGADHRVTIAEARAADPADVYLPIEARGDGSPDGRVMIDLAIELDDADRRAVRAEAADDDDLIRRLGRRSPAARARMLAAADRIGLRELVRVQADEVNP